MFSVDYATLRQIIQQFMYTGVFQAHVTNSRLLPEEGKIELQAKEGNVIACRFVTKQGLVHSWDRWETELARFGILNWDMTTSTQDMRQGLSPLAKPPKQFSPASLPTGQRSPTPYHAVSLSPTQISQWPILYRQVYTLIDGRHQVSDIALMLRKSEREIKQIIDELIRLNLVAFR